MARYNAIQIGSVYLTSNGLVGGTPCKTNVTGLNSLKPATNKNVIKAIDGTPYSQITDGKKGIDLEILIQWISESVFDAINVLMDASDNGDTAIAVVINGDTGDFTIDVKPNVDYVKFDKFSNGILQEVRYKVVTT